MKKNLRDIFLSCILTMAVTDYIWIEFLDNVWVVAEISPEDEKVEKIKEVEKKESRFDHQPERLYPESGLSIGLFSNYQKTGNSFKASLKGNTPKLYILNSQIRIPS
ncbi:MAG: hypothetical protein RIM99_18770 [Cyclobacteriaceae bacterium]